MATKKIKKSKAEKTAKVRKGFDASAFYSSSFVNGMKGVISTFAAEVKSGKLDASSGGSLRGELRKRLKLELKTLTVG